jgi:hypothetical protein
LPVPDWGPTPPDLTELDKDHGFAVAAYAVSKRVGVATAANLVFVAGARFADFFNFERYVEACTLIADDDPLEKDKGIVNMSFGLPFKFASDEVIALIWCKLPFASDDNGTIQWLTLTDKTGELMEIMAENLGIVFVLAGNYIDRNQDAYPDKCMRYIPGGLLVGAVDRYGVASPETPTNESPDVSAPGVNLPPPDIGEEELTGTSFGRSEIVLHHVLDLTLTFLSLL